MVIPDDVEPDSIEADYEDGVLVVTIPKAAELRAPRTTRVAIGKGED